MLRQGATNRMMKSPVHANRLKHFLDSAKRQSKDTEEQRSQPKEVPEEKVIEKILKKTKDRRGDWYRVKYTNRKFKPEWLL